MLERSLIRDASVLVCVSSVRGANHVLTAPATAPAAPPAGPEAVILNPADQAAVKFATGVAGGPLASVLAVHIGPAGEEGPLREALAHGATAALLLETPAGEMVDAARVVAAVVDVCAVARPRWIFCGQATLDWAGGLVGPLLAGLLDWPVIDHIVEVRRDGDRALRCQRVIGRGVRDELGVEAPAVIAVSALAFQPTIPPLRDRLRAQRAVVASRPAGLDPGLPRADRWELTPPRPRPRAMLPSTYSDWSPEDRLAFLTQSVPASAAGPTRWLRGEAGTVAAQLLDFVESSGVRLPWMR